jgi:TonB family protein
MTGGPIHRMDVAGPRAHGDAGDLSGVVPLAERETASSAPPISATNVIPFIRPRRDAPPASSAADVTFDPAARPAPWLIARERRIQIAALLALSLGVHAGVYVLFNRDPEPMASVALDTISVEIVVGDNRPPSPTAGQPQLQQAPADDPKPNPVDADTAVKVEETKPAEATPVREPERLAQNAAPEVAPDRPQPQAAEEPRQRPDQQHVATLPAEETPAPREPELAVAAREPPREAPVEATPTPPEPVRTETKPEPQPKAVQKREPTKKQETRPKERPTRTASTDPNPTGPRSNAAGGAGRGGATSNADYSGRVAAHLMRHKRYPDDARSRGDQGRAMVSFSLDGGGRVTRVSLVRGTGSSSLDQEATAMVRRASPFPAPPEGRAQNFTVPVSFRVQ